MTTRLRESESVFTSLDKHNIPWCFLEHIETIKFKQFYIKNTNVYCYFILHKNLIN